MTKTKAPRSYIEPGHHSIDRVTPRPGPGESWIIDWCVRLPSGRLVEKRTQAATKTLVKARAKRKAEKLLTTGGTATCDPGMSIEKFIDTVTMKSIEDAQYEQSTHRLYVTAVKRIRAELRGMAIADAATHGAVKTALLAIAAKHGEGGAKNAKKVLSGHIVAPLLADGVIKQTPLPKEHPINLSVGAKATVRSPRGSAELTLDHWHTVVEFLLGLDYTDVAPPKRGRWTHADTIAKRRNAVDQALYQCATGLRLSEVVGQAWGDITDGPQGLWLTTTAPKPVRVKGVTVRKERTIPPLLPEVTERMRERRDTAEGPFWLPAPTDPNKAWGVSAAKEAANELYVEMADALTIEPLRTLRGHAWRSVINEELIKRGVPVEQRVAYLGHSKGVNAESYTHNVDLTAVTSLIGKL